MTKVLAISAVTVREAVRQKLAVNLLVFAVALVLASITLSTLTFGEQYRIIANIGLSSMEVFGTLIAAFLGAGLVARDVERKSVYPIITKPVSRARYVTGRYLGLVATTTLNLAVMATVFLLVLAVYLRGFGFLLEKPLGVALLAMAVQFAMVGAVATFFSCFSTTTLSAIFTLAFVVAGHLAGDLVRYWAKQGLWEGRIGKVAYAVVPNLGALDFKEAVVYGDAVDGGLALTALAYGACYAGAVLAFAAFVFSRRDLK